jgi:hypothetical protein
MPWESGILGNVRRAKRFGPISEGYATAFDKIYGNGEVEEITDGMCQECGIQGCRLSMNNILMASVDKNELVNFEIIWGSRLFVWA